MQQPPLGPSGPEWELPTKRAPTEADIVAQGQARERAVEHAHLRWYAQHRRYRLRAIAIHAAAYFFSFMLMAAGGGSIGLLAIPGALAIGAGLTWVMVTFQIPMLLGGLLWGCPAVVGALVMYWAGWWVPASAGGLLAIAPLMVQVCVAFGWIMQGMAIGWFDHQWHQNHRAVAIDQAMARGEA